MVHIRSKRTPFTLAYRNSACFSTSPHLAASYHSSTRSSTSACYYPSNSSHSSAVFRQASCKGRNVTQCSLTCFSTFEGFNHISDCKVVLDALRIGSRLVQITSDTQTDVSDRSFRLVSREEPGPRQERGQRHAFRRPRSVWPLTGFPPLEHIVGPFRLHELIAERTALTRSQHEDSHTRCRPHTYSKLHSLLSSLLLLNCA